MLAAAYLHDELGVGDDESVAVCPVDPYVDNSYYEGVEALEKLVQQNTANLTLMGIAPTYPSEKYGYIIPESSNEVSTVKEFKEKPDKATAEKYLAQNAVWNAGVFAFKLGYLLEKAHAMVDFEDYRDLYSKYETLTKISFDYAVVEKETSIQVMRYNGDWKDVGTWNMMAEVMADNIKGKAVMDDTCVNTQIVNELNIPILAMGCKDMVIAASGDGILISDKERSGYMKPYVEKISTEVMFAEKSWGTYTVMDVQEGSMTVKVSMQAGQKLSYHYHNSRDEVWTVVAGQGKAIVDGMKQILRAGDVVTIAAGCKHTIEAVTNLDIIEVQIGETISVADKYKSSLN
ncbi:sugar phosphate nucleotidyltransferase [Enterococcus faecium]